MNELICDGVLVSTSAGSTAYNLSAQGSILPLDSKLLALTPISAFRPRRWRGALLSEKNIIEITVINFMDRKVSVTADNIEYRNIKEVSIQSSQDKNCKILFDNNHSIEDKILNEQFEY
jgi:NAD+ kinase